MPNSKKKITKKIDQLVKEFTEKFNNLLTELKKEEKKKNETLLDEYLPELFAQISEDYGINQEELHKKYLKSDSTTNITNKVDTKNNDNICEYTVIEQEGKKYYVNKEINNSDVFKDDCNNKVGSWDKQNNKIILL